MPSVVQAAAHDRQQAGELREDQRLVAFLAAPRAVARAARRAWRWVRRGACGSIRPGWQAAWRSRSSASSTWIFDFAMPSRADLAAAANCDNARAVRRRACAARGSSSQKMVCSVLAGSSRATCSLVRRRMNGRSAWASSWRVSSLGFRAAPPASLNTLAAPSMPGLRNSNSVHKLAQMILHRRAAERQAMVAAQQAHGLGRFGAGILDGLGFVENHVIELDDP